MAADDRGETEILIRDRYELKEPEDYAVVLLNDDFTTRDFVVEILIEIFHKSPEEAERLMLSIHYKGRAAVGLYTWDIANTKASQVHAAAKEYDFPLRCVVEEA